MFTSGEADIDTAELLRRYEVEMRRDAWVPGLPAEQLSDITRYYDAAQREVLIMWHRFDPQDTSRVVERELDYFAGATDFTWKIYAGDQPDNLAGELEARGLSHDGDMQLMMCAADTLAAMPLPTGAELRWLQDRREADQLAAVWNEVWPEGSGGWVDVLGEALSTQPDRIKMVVARVDGVPASAGYLTLDPRKTFAYLGGGSTVAAHRGLGLYRTLVLARARIAHAAGIRYLAVEARPESAPILARLGFQRITTLRFFERPRTSTSA